ncbi:hypothetical protein ACHAXS_009039 [Conticribra weissflogii]
MIRSRIFLFTKSLIVVLAILDGSLSFQLSATQIKIHRHTPSNSALHIFKTTEEDKTVPKAEEPSTKTPSVEETTEKYGLEAGLLQSLRSPDSASSAKALLAKYGIAYLATSIPLALVSFLICYSLVDNGVDVGALLAKVGITNVGDTGEKAGTFAIAYAAHKAASPIRFPPTVLLTPVVAKLIGKEPNEDVDIEES